MLNMNIRSSNKIFAFLTMLHYNVSIIIHIMKFSTVFDTLSTFCMKILQIMIIHLTLIIILSAEQLIFFFVKNVRTQTSLLIFLSNTLSLYYLKRWRLNHSYFCKMSPKA